MIYSLLACCLIAIALLCNVILKTHIFKQRETWIAFGIMLVLTIVFDKMLVTIPIVTYTTNMISGITIWGIPIEDFSYTIAIVLLTISLNTYYERIS